MKKQRKTGPSVAIIALLFVVVSAFPACINSKETATFLFHDGNTVIGTIEIEISGFDTVADAIISQKYGSLLNADSVADAYGLLINAIYGLNPDGAKGEFISVYHTLRDFYDDTGMDGYAEPEKTAAGITFYCSTVGVSSMPLQAGASYLFVIMS